MKLRIRDDSLRLRLGRSEVERLAAEGLVEAAMHVGPGQRLRYAVERDDTLAAPVVRLQGSDLVVGLPAAVVERWVSSEDVSIEGTQTFEGRALAILVEKDFQCLIPRTGRDTDAFPNPKA